PPATSTLFPSRRSSDLVLRRAQSRRKVKAMSNLRLTRRGLLGVVGGSAAAVVLAACGSSAPTAAPAKPAEPAKAAEPAKPAEAADRKSTRLNSSHQIIS